MINGMTRDDVEIVEFPYPDDWYDKPEMLVAPMNNPSELWLRRDLKHDLGVPSAGNGAAGGKVDAIYTAEQVLPASAGGHRQVQDRSRTCRGIRTGPCRCANAARRHHLHRRDGQRAPRARRRVPEGHDQGWALVQRAQARRGRDPQQADLLPRRRGHVPGIKNVDMVPSLSPRTWQPSRSARTSC